MMRWQLGTWVIVGALGLTSWSCAMLDGEGGEAASGSQVVEQPVFLQPVFELADLDNLPKGLRLDDLHVGVGAIFLDLLGSEDNIAFANRTPFRLHFYISDGQLIADAPSMTLPQGGRYQISVQIEPQDLLADDGTNDGLRSLDEPGAESSLIVNGRVAEASYSPDDDDEDEEPAPLPWHPTEVEDVSQLIADIDVISFSYTSRRSARFILAEVELEGGTSNELVMQLQVGNWVQETIRPALNRALGEIETDEPETEPLEDLGLDLGDRVESEDGMDGLIGDISIVVR